MDDVLVGWATASRAEAMEDLLNDAERARLGTLRRSVDRTAFVAAHGLLRHLIAGDLGVAVGSVDVVQHCTRCGRAHGQPRILVDGLPGPAVSLAHVAGVVVAVRATRPVGVDLELEERLDPSMASVVLSERERAELDAVDPSERSRSLTRTWVRKEAVLKAAGTGLLADPRRLVISDASEAAGVVAWAHPGPWALADVDLVPGHAAAIALRAGRMPTIRVRQVDLAAVS